MFHGGLGLLGIGAAITGVALYQQSDRAVPLIAISLVAGLAMTVVGRLLTWRDERLWQYGEVCAGHVVARWDESRGSGTSNTTVHFIEYRYELPAGTFTRRWETRLPCDEPTIWVVYDPQRPERSMPYLW